MGQELPAEVKAKGCISNVANGITLFLHVTASGLCLSPCRRPEEEEEEEEKGGASK